MIPPEHKEAHEVQFIGWGEHHSTGPWIKFRLVDRESYEHFKQFSPEGKNQQRFYLVAVPIDDNEEPKPAPEKKERKPFHELSRAQQAGMRCKEPAFQEWILLNSDKWGVSLDNLDDTTKDTMAGKTVRLLCRVGSRSELNTNVAAANRWDILETRYREETQLPDQR